MSRQILIIAYTDCVLNMVVLQIMFLSILFSSLNFKLISQSYLVIINYFYLPDNRCHGTARHLFEVLVVPTSTLLLFF